MIKPETIAAHELAVFNLQIVTERARAHVAKFVREYEKLKRAADWEEKTRRHPR